MFLQVSLSPEVEYTVLIDDGVGPTVRERVSSPNCNSTHCSHTYYPGEGSRGVTVEAAGCVTRQTVCQETPVCKLHLMSAVIAIFNLFGNRVVFQISVRSHLTSKRFGVLY